MSAAVALGSAWSTRSTTWSRCGACTGFPVLLVSLLAGPLAGMQNSSATYQVTTVQDGATLNGEIVFSGQVPRPKRLLITKDIEVCGQGYRERRQVAVGSGGGLRDVVVFIEGIEKGKPWPGVSEGYLMDQVDCYFDPHVQVVQWGAELNIVNSDPVLHNIHSYELTGGARRTLFNFGQPPEKGIISQALRPRRGRQIRLECDAHDFMLAWIYVTDNPYAVAVDADGHFTIDNISPGTYTVKAWHPYLGMQEQEITLSAKETSEIAFQFSSN